MQWNKAIERINVKSVYFVLRIVLDSSEWIHNVIHICFCRPLFLFRIRVVLIRIISQNCVLKDVLTYVFDKEHSSVLSWLLIITHIGITILSFFIFTDDSWILERRWIPLHGFLRKYVSENEIVHSERKTYA